MLALRIPFIAGWQSQPLPLLTCLHCHAADVGVLVSPLFQVSQYLGLVHQGHLQRVMFNAMFLKRCSRSSGARVSRTSGQGAQLNRSNSQH
jgi:hypothetical protein